MECRPCVGQFGSAFVHRFRSHDVAEQKVGSGNLSHKNDFELSGRVAIRDRMCEVGENILKAKPKRLAAFLELDPGCGRLWRPDELAAILKHQLAAPVQLDLAE